MRPTAFSLVLALAAWPAPEAFGVAPSDRCAVVDESLGDRPDPDGTPTRVAVGIFLNELRGIDAAAQSFAADAYVVLTWDDPRLAALAGCTLPLNAIWNPLVVIRNAWRIEPSTAGSVEIDSAGGARVDRRFRGEFFWPLHLHDYPFDRHSLGIEVLSTRYGPDEVAFAVDERRTGGAQNLSLAEWSVASGEAEVAPYFVTPAERFLSRTVFRLEVERQKGFYLWKVLFPLGLIVFMSWTVFWIDPSDLAPQLAVATSAVLTLIAFQFSLGYLLPKLSYLTRADRFLLGAMLLVFLALGEAVLTSLLAGRGNAALAIRVDRVMRWLFPLGFLAVIAVAFRL